jgi:hypothetical protein
MSSTIGSYGRPESFEFVGKCPPDIQEGTRIVAVCGVSGPNAAPEADGWLFSDFFLYYQMLRSRCKLLSIRQSELPIKMCFCSNLIRTVETFLVRELFIRISAPRGRVAPSVGIGLLCHTVSIILI